MKSTSHSPILAAVGAVSHCLACLFLIAVGITGPPSRLMLALASLGVVSLPVVVAALEIRKIELPAGGPQRTLGVSVTHAWALLWPVLLSVSLLCGWLGYVLVVEGSGYVRNAAAIAVSVSIAVVGGCGLVLRRLKGYSGIEGQVLVNSAAAAGAALLAMTFSLGLVESFGGLGRPSSWILYLVGVLAFVVSLLVQLRRVP